MIQWLEIAGVAVGLAYLWLEYRASVWLWLAGIVMPAIYVFVYYSAGFYADAGINIYYLAAGIYGWALWAGKKSGAKKSPPRRIGHTPGRLWLPLTVAAALASGAILFVLLRYTDSTVPWGDSITTGLSIVALWMLAQKYAEQWLVWIVVDVIACGLYVYKGLYPTAALYGLYSVIAVAGYFKWVRMIKQQTA